MPTANATKSRDLTQGPIFKTLAIFALPTLLSNILQSLNASINTVWVGKFLGETALAATANASIIMFLVFSAVFGFGMAATVMVGQYFGRHDIDAARRIFGSAIGFCLILSILVGVLGWTFSDWILTHLNTPQDAFTQAHAYLRVIFIALPSTMMSVIVMMGMRGSGDSMTPMWFMGLNVVLDIILNPLLILGVGPFPQLGIVGSAVATIIAGYGSLIAMIVTMYWSKLPLRLVGRELNYLIPRINLLKIIIGKGVPMGLQMVVMATAALVMISLVNREGLMTTAAYSAMQQLWTYVQMPSMAVGAAVSAMVAQNIGAGKWERVNKVNTAGLLSTLLLTGSIIAILLIFDRPVLGLFLGKESGAMAIADHMQYRATWSYMLFGMAMVIFATMRANGVVIIPLLIIFVSLYPVRLGFYYLTYNILGADAIWISFPVGAFTCLILAFIYYKTGLWRKNSMTQPSEKTQKNA
ncbi:MATE family efflux transporter [Bartonella sp. HY761]|uniref:MATE family efflux transporter n=1 Tax=Bartonella sp. HY761 TaxID=2979330 RepID=UPI0021F9C260|nr:MATE family efflux transporter [Bartonella sp. HY761]UXN05705.1 MATE family efflux transporter [Bartonella sp. HY761]